MLRSLHTAASGMLAQQNHIDVISHNMANVGTTGFRRMRAEFQDLLYQELRAPGARQAGNQINPTGLQIGLGVRTHSTQIQHVQGALSQTGNPTDLAIEGTGFFQIRRPDGEIAYTRNGNFQINPDGQLVNADGFQVEPSINIPQGATSFTVAADGTVSVTMPNSTETQEVGRLELATFMNPGGLEASGRNLYRATSASGQALVAQPTQESLGAISQGMLESSNVEVVTEMIDLIASQRAYEINHRVIQASDEMLKKTTEF